MELLVYDQLWDMASKVGGALIVTVVTKCFRVFQIMVYFAWKWSIYGRSKLKWGRNGLDNPQF